MSRKQRRRAQQEFEGELLELELESLAHGGEAMARRDGQVVFVMGGLPGERVKVQVFQRYPDYLRARLLEVLQPSPHRVAAPCPHFGECGGCQLQHVAYAEELALKQRIVAEQLRRIGGLAEAPLAETIGMSEPWHYRNHARFTALRNGVVGFTRHHARYIIPIERCLLMLPPINQVLARLQGRSLGVHNVSVRYGENTGELLVMPRLPQLEPELVSGQKHLAEELLGHRFRVAASSFFQVNTRQAAVLARTALAGLALRGGETVVDAYCGVGTFAVLLAERAARVVGIEEAASSLVDARHNARQFDNVEFVHAPVEQALDAFAAGLDGVIIDPPRAGCKPKVLAALVAAQPRRLVYVSCDPATLARDLRLLVEGGFQLESVQPIDMFPQTYHVETVAAMSWGGN